MSDRVGQQWGNYRLTRLLGQGGFAEVYQGQHLRLNMFAAIKILHTHLSEEGTEAFQREAQVIAELIHPHIVRVLDFDVREGIPFLVLDYAPNGSLPASPTWHATSPQSGGTLHQGRGQRLAVRSRPQDHPS